MDLDSFDREDWTAVVAVRVAGGTLLIVPRDASSTLTHLRIQFGSAAFSTVSVSGMSVDAALASRPDATAQVRQLLVSRHLIGPMQASGEAIREYVKYQVESPLGGSLIAILLPPNFMTTYAARGQPVAVPDGVPTAREPPASKRVADMSVGERVFAMVSRLPAYLGPAAGKAFSDALASLATPEAQLVLIACLTFLAASQAAGVGEVADAALLAWAYSQLGWSGLCAMWRMLGALIDAAKATTDEALNAAARKFAVNLAKLGMDCLLLFISWAARRSGRSRASEEESAGGRPSGSRSGRSSSRAANPLYDDPSGVVRTRVQQLQDQIPANSQGRITMAVGVVQDENGARSVLVATSEPRGYLRPGVSLDPGETMVSGTGHAEADIADYASQNNLDLISVGATRPVCAGCQGLLGPTGTDIATPLK